MPRVKFASTNRKHYLDLGSDTSSVWNYCARSLDVILRGKINGGVKNAGNFLRLIMFWLKVTWLQRESKDVVHNKVCCH